MLAILIKSIAIPTAIFCGEKVIAISLAIMKKHADVSI